MVVDWIVQPVRGTVSPQEIFLRIRRAGGLSFFLDSSLNIKQLGAFAFIGIAPFKWMWSRDRSITICEQRAEQNKKVVRTVQGNPFDMLATVLDEYHVAPHEKAPFPFCGGAVGYLGYELHHHLENMPRTASRDLDLPDMFFGLYDIVIVCDTLTHVTSIVGMRTRINHDLEQRMHALHDLIQNAATYTHPVKGREQHPHTKKAVPISNFSFDAYCHAVRRAKAYIQQGDIYQVNLSQRFCSPITTSPFDLYVQLRSRNPSPFAAYLDFQDFQLVSCSPERFLKISDGQIETRPIKGTAPRGTTDQEDHSLKTALLQSEKNQAENLMIVDLMRNDLGRVCKIGSIRVPELFSVESYSTVHHLVSHVVGALEEEVSIIDCVKACFPGGSITGAPKIRAMEIIDELEPVAREVYTGSIGYLSFHDTCDFNIAIRTITVKDHLAYYHVGGGIVWDSSPQDEYEETLHKGRALHEVLSQS